jgi:hypothetical protein
MKAATIGLLALLVCGGCGKQQQAEKLASGIQAPMYNEVIDNRNGYIVENARLPLSNETPDLVLDGKCGLKEGTAQVMVLRTASDDKSQRSVLALELPAFTDGSVYDFAPGGPKAQYWVISVENGTALASKCGSIEGRVRFIKSSASQIDLGLGREMLDAIGEIEISVSGITPAGTNSFDANRKYAARFQLPILTSAEFRRINKSSI